MKKYFEIFANKYELREYTKIKIYFKNIKNVIEKEIPIKEQ